MYAFIEFCLCVTNLICVTLLCTMLSDCLNFDQHLLGLALLYTAHELRDIALDAHLGKRLKHESVHLE
jgi:hypothetical protein